MIKITEKVSKKYGYEYNDNRFKDLINIFFRNR